MIEYIQENDFATSTVVLLDNKVTGHIKHVEGGWQYWPLRSKTGGETFRTIGECKKSLEGN